MQWQSFSEITLTEKKIIDRNGRTGIVFFFKYWENVGGIASYNYDSGNNPEVVVAVDTSGGNTHGTSGGSKPTVYLQFIAHNDGVYVTSQYFNSSNHLDISIW